MRTQVAWCLMWLALPAMAAERAHAQQPPAGDQARSGAPVTTGAPLSLSLGDAVQRGLVHNLTAILQEQQVNAAAGARLDARSALLPHVNGLIRGSGQVINTAAFGFSGFEGLPSLIGPFGVFDARLAMTAPIFDAEARHDLQAKDAGLAAAQADYRQVRETVILAIANLYLQTLSDDARSASARSEVTTAEALERLAEDRRASGLAAQIDVLRQQVQLQSARARLITADNAAAKGRLQLAHAIGLPSGQPFTLSDSAPFSAVPPMPLETALADAAAHRDDLRSAEARVTAAQSARDSESAARLPSLHFDGDFGALGPTLPTAGRTFTAGLSVRMPLFDGGHVSANIQKADATLHQRQAELEDLRSSVQDDVRAAMLDVTAAEAGVDVARNAQALSREELTQAEDRFRAGVATTVELVQAQESVTRADEQYIASVYAHSLAKASLVHSLGEVEESLVKYLGGQP